VPITAKLSNKFYEKLGDDVANELVEWLNLVDTSYRQEFKDLFEANFRRLESEMRGLWDRVEGELAGLRAETGARIAGLEGVMAARLLGVEGRMVELQGRLLAQVDARMERLEVKLGKQKWSLLTWTILMWLGTLGFMAALLRH
jgi:hypothetical protein